MPLFFKKKEQNSAFVKTRFGIDLEFESSRRRSEKNVSKVVVERLLPVATVAAHTLLHSFFREEREEEKKATFHPLFTPPPAHIFMTRLLKKVSKLFGNEKKEQHRNWHDFA